MIDPNWSVIDLDSRTWRNLGRFIDVSQYLRTAQPEEHGLFVLHDGGRPLRVFNSRAGVRADLGIAQVDDPRLLAHSLFETGEWDRVHVIDKRHLAGVARRAQTIENRALQLDAYYHRVFELMWQDPLGYASVPPHPGHWNGWTYSGVQHFLEALPSPASLALGVFEGEALSIGLIVEARAGSLQRVTTFEALPALAAEARLSADFMRRLWTGLEETFAPPAAALLYTAAGFETWISAADKSASLTQALQSGAALLRLPGEPAGR